jgi:hypothetical protein
MDFGELAFWTDAVVDYNRQVSEATRRAAEGNHN